MGQPLTDGGRDGQVGDGGPEDGHEGPLGDSYGRVLGKEGVYECVCTYIHGCAWAASAPKGCPAGRQWDGWVLRKAGTSHLDPSQLLVSIEETEAPWSRHSQGPRKAHIWPVPRSQGWEGASASEANSGGRKGQAWTVPA